MRHRGTILACAVCLAWGAGARAAGDTADGGVGPPPDGGDHTPLPSRSETVVTSLRLPRPSTDSTSTVTVLSRQEIARSPALEANDLLRTLPAVGTFRRNSSLVADPTAQGLSLRGVGPSGVSRALVLVDEMPLNDAFGGWIYWRALSLLDTGQVEVAPTGASALYGNFGLGGVAQFLSRPLGPAVDATASGGSFGTFEGAGRASGVAGPVSGAAFGEVLTTSGYDVVAAPERGAIDVPASSTHGLVGARAEVRPTARLALGLHGRFFEEDQNGGTFWTRSSVRVGWYGLSARYESAQAGTFTAQAFGSNELFAQDRGRPSSDRSTESQASTQSVPSNGQGASLVWTAPAELTGARQSILAGVDLLRAHGFSHEHLFPASPRSNSPVSRDAGGEQRFLGLFAEDVLHLSDAWEVSTAARLDLWQDRLGERRSTAASGNTDDTRFPDQGGSQWNPKLGVRYRPADWLALRGSVYRAFRAPTLNELYRPFQVGTILTDANASLRPETLWGGELGPQLTLGGCAVRLTGFWNTLHDPVTNVTLATPAPDGATRERRNLGVVQVRGLDLELDWRIARQWSATAAYVLSASEVTSAPGLPMLVGKRLTQAPLHRAAASVAFDDPRILTATIELRFNGPQYEDDQNRLPMGGFVLVGFRVSRRLGAGFEVFGAVENLFDRTYLVGRAGIDTVGQPFLVRAGLQFRAFE